jgi:hypothetical protein
MELIDRYLQSAKWMLPRKNREDVLRELSDEILSRVEEKEDALGHPLTEDEQVDLLKQMGHPMLVASRYRTQRYLINPSTFVIYWMVLRLILAIVFVGMAIAAVAVAASGQGAGKALGVIFQYPFAALSVFAWVTTIFVVLEIIQVKFDFFGKWDPRTLPKLSKKEPKHSLAESIAGLVLGLIFGIWWLVGLKHQFWIFGPGVAVVRFGPVWQTMYPLFVVLVIVSVIRATIDVVRPGWEKARLGFNMFFRLANLALLLFFLKAPELVIAADASKPELLQVVSGINRVAHLCVIVAIAMTVAQAAWDLYTYFFRDGKDGRNGAVSLKGTTR